MNKPVSFIAATSAGVALLLLGGALWLREACPGRVAEVMAAFGAAPALKPYHIGENPWAGAWLPRGDAVAVPNAPDTADRQRLARHSASSDTCERKAGTAKPRISSSGTS